MPHSFIHSALSAACAGQALSAEEAERLLALLPGGLTDLLSLAGAARIAGGSTAFTCGIINAKSGRCGEDCSFCAQSRHHDTAAAVYPLVGEDVLLERAQLLAQSGVDYMGIVSSGVGPAMRDLEHICRAAERIRQEFDIKLCASLGLLEQGQALALKQAGFTSYHHNLECARSYFGRVCTTHSYERQRETVKQAGAAGLRKCTGGIFGLGESWRQRLELSIELRELDVDSIPINFLTPIAGTPLEHAPPLEIHEALGIIALLRLMHPDKDILLCGGRSRTLGEWENSLFFAGANGLMVGDYLTLKGNPLAKDMRMLRAIGLKACV
jgi:biotin synthase